MSYFKTHIDEYFIQILKVKLAEKIGYVISNKPDCAKLSELISQKGNEYISESTIYRIFFQSEKHTPYKNTLDIICRYVGYKDVFEFIEFLNDEKRMLYLNGISTNINSSNNLLFHCIENNSFKTLYDFFESFDEKSHHFKTYTAIGLFDSLQLSKKQVEFFEYFASQKFIREYFLEQGHDPKFRLKNYDIAYLKYLEVIEKETDSVQLQDYVFGNCVLFRYYFLKQNFEKLAVIGQKLYETNLNQDIRLEQLYIFPFIRYKAYKLWYLQVNKCNNIELQDYANYLLHLCEKVKSNMDFIEKKILFHTIAETFLHTNLPETFHQNLKNIFIEEFQKIPNIVYQKHLKYSLPYFEQNGLIFLRP
jgi:F0F1-type ATP synthase delta subunit